MTGEIPIDIDLPRDEDEEAALVAEAERRWPGWRLGVFHLNWILKNAEVVQGEEGWW